MVSLCVQFMLFAPPLHPTTTIPRPVLIILVLVGLSIINQHQHSHISASPDCGAVYDFNVDRGEINVSVIVCNIR